MTQPIGYWCPVCECIAEGKLCKRDGSLGLVSTVDDVVIVPLSQWHAMHERHEADQAALRSALARVVEVEALAHWAAKSHTEMAELAKRDRENMAKLRAENERLTAELATTRGQP